MTKIKICGITNLDDAVAAIEAGADMLGFNFYPKSPRFIDIGLCRGITSRLRNRYANVVFVGVFVNMPPVEVYATIETCGLALAQLHGDESLQDVAALNGRAFKAFRGVPADITDYTRSDAPALLVDAAAKGVYGGSGIVANWSAATELSKRVPLLLAGGLTPENIADAVRQVQPWGVDVASGVESIPGKKDAEKMKRFVAAVRQIESVKS